MSLLTWWGQRQQRRFDVRHARAHWDAASRIEELVADGDQEKLSRMRRERFVMAARALRNVQGG